MNEVTHDQGHPTSGVETPENLARDVLNGLPEGCQIIGFDWTYLFVNDVVTQQGRKTKEDLLGRTMMDCYPGIDETPMFVHLRRCMTERQPDRMENEFTFPDGSPGWFELRFIPVPQGACILSRDITEASYRLSAIVEHSQDAIIGMTLDGIVTSWNRSAERIFGYAAAEMLGQSVARLMPTGRQDEATAIAARVALGEYISHFETVRRRKDGQEIDVSITLSPVRDGSGHLVGVSKIGRDISQLKGIQRELSSAVAATEAANRELESFSYSVAHDLRAPLRAIDGFSQALLEDCVEQLDDDGRRYLALTREAAKRMAELIDDLLGLARVSRSDLHRQKADLSALARATVVRLQRGYPDRQLNVVIQDGVSSQGDTRLLGIVFDNLLGNAVKFSGKRENARVEFGTTTHNGFTAYFIRDNGAGFDMAYADKLFGVFQRLHSTSEFEGTGVGLATVQRIVRRHSGRVWAEGAMNEGATFYFTLYDEEAGHE